MDRPIRQHQSLVLIIIDLIFAAGFESVMLSNFVILIVLFFFHIFRSVLIILIFPHCPLDKCSMHRLCKFIQVGSFQCHIEKVSLSVQNILLSKSQHG